LFDIVFPITAIGAMSTLHPPSSTGPYPSVEKEKRMVWNTVMAWLLMFASTDLVKPKEKI
jgi:hypothetical protein